MEGRPGFARAFFYLVSSAGRSCCPGESFGPSAGRPRTSRRLPAPHEPSAGRSPTGLGFDRLASWSVGLLAWWAQHLVRTPSPFYDATRAAPRIPAASRTAFDVSCRHGAKRRFASQRRRVSAWSCRPAAAEVGHAWGGTQASARALNVCARLGICGAWIDADAQLIKVLLWPP